MFYRWYYNDGPASYQNARRDGSRRYSDGFEAENDEKAKSIAFERFAEVCRTR